MISKILPFFFFLIIFFTQQMFTQTSGTITGKIIEASTGEPVISANVILEGTMLGAATDLDGNYNISKIQAGVYNLRASCISYSSQVIKDIKIVSGKITVINIALTEENISVDEIVVTGTAQVGFEAAELNRQKNSLKIEDGISAEQIKKAPDANMADVLKRVKGITVDKGKFIFVRGLSDRYSVAQLNDAVLPSAEIDKKSFTFDLISSSVIENTSVIKTFSPDLPGDFAGGLVRINTVEFPYDESLKLNYGVGFSTGTTSKSFFTYRGGELDWLGLDDGTRALPGGFPSREEWIRLTNGLYNKEDYKTLGDIYKQFAEKSYWNVSSKKAPINQDFNISFSNIYKLLGNDLGLVSSLSYKTKYNSQDFIIRLKKENSPKNDYSGTQYISSVFWGGVFNLSYKLSDFTKLSSKNTYTVDSDDNTSLFSGFDQNRGANQIVRKLDFISRKLFSTQLISESVFPSLNSSKLNLNLSYGKANRDEPDKRQYLFQQTSDGEYRMNVSYQDGKSLAREYFFSEENIRTVSIDYTQPLLSFKIKTGGFYSNSTKSSDSRQLQFFSPSERFSYELTPDTDLDLFFSDSAKFQYPNKMAEIVDYNAMFDFPQIIAAGYSLIDLPFKLYSEEFVFSGGARFENTVTRFKDSKGYGRIRNIDNNEHDILPALGLVYKINDNYNFRINYSKTVNRPELREVSPFKFYDYQEAVTVYGNPDLIPAKIENYDLRMEFYPNPGEVISASYFYKSLQNAIEKTAPYGDNPSKTFRNNPLAKNSGYELEMRFSLGHLSDLLSDFSLNANYTSINSKIKNAFLIAAGGSGNRVNGYSRPLQGQAPYIVNIGLYWKNSNSGSEVSVLFNRVGKTITGAAEYEDVEDMYSTPRDLIDLVYKQKLFWNIDAKFSVKNLLSEDEVEKMGDLIVRSFSGSRDFSFSLTFNL